MKTRTFSAVQATITFSKWTLLHRVRQAPYINYTRPYHPRHDQTSKIIHRKLHLPLNDNPLLHTNESAADGSSNTCTDRSWVIWKSKENLVWWNIYKLNHINRYYCYKPSNIATTRKITYLWRDYCIYSFRYGNKYTLDSMVSQTRYA